MPLYRAVAEGVHPSTEAVPCPEETGRYGIAPYGEIVRFPVGADSISARYVIPKPCATGRRGRRPLRRFFVI